MKALCIALFMFGIAGIFPAAAQQCTGDLGDPVFIETFGSGSDVNGSALPAGGTEYIFSNADEPVDGAYTITRTTPVMGTLWWLTRDHTDDPGGYMMIVNARSAATGILYRRQVSGLCPSTTFEASAWVMNLLKAVDNSPPNLLITVETMQGAELGKFSTGLIAKEGSALWKKFGFFFTSPADGSDVVIKVRNQTLGSSPGNDFALDDIAFRPCGPLVVASIGGTQQFFKAICTAAQETLNLTCSTPAGYTHPVYQWQVSTGNGWEDIVRATTATTDVVFNNQVIGAYKYRVKIRDLDKAISCGTISNNVDVKVVGKPEPKVENSGPVCEGGTLKLICKGSETDTYSWTGPGGFQSVEQNPVIEHAGIQAAGLYTVTATAAGSCTSIAQTTVSVKPAQQVSAGADQILCSGNSVMLHASGSGNYTWSPAAGLSDVHSATPMATPTETTVYEVRASNGSCEVTDQVKITVLKTAPASAGPDKSILRGRSIELEGQLADPNSTFYWAPALYLDDIHALHPRCSATEDITYTLHTLSANGCDVSADEVQVRVFDDLVFRNTFTPNGDGINDRWSIEGLESFPDAQVLIFNRYGMRVFESRGYGKAWDGLFQGREMPAGAYYYTITLSPGKAPYRGSITLLR